MEKKKKKKLHSLSLPIKDQLAEKETELYGDDSILGITLLTNPGYISSSRAMMVTMHMKQLVNLNEPDFPKVFTNYENLVGKYSTNYYKVKEEKVIIERVVRFQDDEDQLYFLFTYDKETDFYDVIEKRLVENLTEKFGFSFNTDVMDNKKVGDTLKKDEVLYKSLSYDDDMNYCYGINTRVLYLLHNHTIEDAAICSESYANRMMSKEIESVTVSLNDNDIFCNIYGSGKDDYKCFPDIGEEIKEQILCAKRRVHNNQLLFDLKRSNLRKINFTSDVPYYCSGRIIDVMVYCNKNLDDLEDNDFNKQIKKYLKDQDAFYKNLFAICKKIVDDGKNCSDYIKYLYRRSKEYLDPNYKWRTDDGNTFSHIIIEFLVERDVPLLMGSKITGTSGDKSVISSIVPDEEMPFIEVNGKIQRIEVILNTLGVVNRLNSWQLYQVSINFICNRVAEKLEKMTNRKEQENLLFDIIKRFNTNQYKKVKEYYNELSKIEKDEFFSTIYEDGIFIHIPPLWENESETLFDRINNIYKEYPWIERYDVFVNKFGRKIKMLEKLVVGQKYMVKMKQTSKKGFSARATGPISKQGLPSKSAKAKNNLDLWSQTPIRLGIDENINLCIGSDPRLTARMHLFYRNSVDGRKELSKDLSTSIKNLKKFKYRDGIKNRNIEILQAYLKCLGYKLDFSEEYYTINIKDTDICYRECSDGSIFIGDEYGLDEHERLIESREEILTHECFIGSESDFDKELKQRVNEKREQDKYYTLDI